MAIIKQNEERFRAWLETNPNLGSPFFWQRGIWRPIESAPKDGTRILLVDMGDGYVLPPEIVIGHWDGQEWRDDQDIGCAGQYDYEPTHWMMLPELPKA